jgi:hypothetical protein
VRRQGARGDELNRYQSEDKGTAAIGTSL